MEIKNKFNHIQVAIDIANTVRTTLGPKGMNKMLLNSADNSAIATNDGATIIKNLKIEHPIGEMIKKLAESQEKAVGDGTTTAVIFMGLLLENALSLLNKKVHPTTIINGYNISLNEAINFTREIETSGDVEKIMKTSFGSKIPKNYVEHFVKLIKEADIENLKTFMLENANPFDSRVVKGFIFDGYTINDRMPKEVEGKIAVIEMRSNLDFAKFNITSTDELNKLNERLKKYKKDIVKNLVEKNVKCVFYTDTNPELETYITEAGLMGIVVYRRDYLDHICKACNATAIADTDFDEKYLGYGKVKYDELVEITSDNSTIDTLLICGPTKQVTEEINRAVQDVIGVLRHLDNCVVGAGAYEIELANHLYEFSKQIEGKEQIAIKKFAEAVETIPMILAENCGWDAMEVLTLLKTEHLKGNKNLGVDEFKMISDAKEKGIIEPVTIKLHALSAATDVANLILKMDDIYISK